MESVLAKHCEIDLVGGQPLIKNELGELRKPYTWSLIEAINNMMKVPNSGCLPLNSIAEWLLHGHWLDVGLHK